MPTKSIPQLLSTSAEHFTPPAIIAAAKTVMGGIDLDPASCALANNIVGAKTIFTIDDDGLTKPWTGRVFVNPPGGRRPDRKSSQAVFWEKAVGEWASGDATAIIFLAFNLELLRLSQANAALPSALRFPFCVPRDRLEFLKQVNGSLVPQTDPTHANAVVFMPATAGAAELELFRTTFSKIGAVVLPTERAERHGHMRQVVP